MYNRRQGRLCNTSSNILYYLWTRVFISLTVCVHSSDEQNNDSSYKMCHQFEWIQMDKHLMGSH